MARSPIQSSQPRIVGTPEQRAQALADWMSGLAKQLANRMIRIEAVLDAIAAVGALTQSISDPPTKAEVEALQAKVNAIIAASELE